MKKIFVCLMAALTLLSCKTALEPQSCKPVLERGAWNDDTYQALTTVIFESENQGNYAVFDCDYTTIIHDVTHAMIVYQIENLLFSLAPEHNFLDGLDEVDFPLEGLGLTAREMGQVLANEYTSLKQEMNESLYRDFRARLMAFEAAIHDNYDYRTLCLWEPSLFAGFTQEELNEMARECLTQAFAQKPLVSEQWVSPDGRVRGTAHKGLANSPEMKNLYACLTRSGITPYVCSASVEWLVELLCCDKQWGLGLSEDQVFGLRFVKKEDGSWDYEADYTQPFKAGKVACINRFIAPQHENRSPVLIAGDSEGDVEMLTAYPDLKMGLIIDWGRSGAIRELADRHDGKYFSQQFKK